MAFKRKRQRQILIGSTLLVAFIASGILHILLVYTIPDQLFPLEPESYSTEYIEIETVIIGEENVENAAIDVQEQFQSERILTSDASEVISPQNMIAKKIFVRNHPIDLEDIQTVQITRRGNKLTTRLNMKLEPGDIIETNSESTMVVSLLEGNNVVLGPNTKIALSSSSIFLFIGRVFIQSQNFFQVETEYVIAGTGGTEFLVTVNPITIAEMIRYFFSSTLQSSVSIAVFDGTINMKSKNDLWTPIILKKLDKVTMEVHGSLTEEIVGGDELNELKQWLKPINPSLKIFDIQT